MEQPVHDLRSHVPAEAPNTTRRTGILVGVGVLHIGLIWALIAGLADNSSNQRLKFGLLSMLAPCAWCWRVHGYVAMSAIEYSSPPSDFAWPSRVSSSPQTTTHPGVTAPNA